MDEQKKNLLMNLSVIQIQQIGRLMDELALAFLDKDLEKVNSCMEQIETHLQMKLKKKEKKLLFLMKKRNAELTKKYTEIEQKHYEEDIWDEAITEKKKKIELKIALLYQRKLYKLLEKHGFLIQLENE